MTALNPKIVKYFSTLIESETGIQYNSINEHLLENRLRELAKTLGHADVDAFWIQVQTRSLRGNEKDMVLDLATNNETTFFRDPEVFDFFRNQFIPNLPSTHSVIKIWSAACSTGQEPYSLAMIFAQLQEQGALKTYHITASDFSERVLNQAKQGLYSQLEIQRGLPAQLMVRYFEQIAESGGSAPKYKIKSELARHITFKRLNLLESWPNHGPFDIIFCRNVLIYQEVENKKRVINKLAQLLTPGGYLVLGGAESLLGLSSDFEMQIHGKACVYKIKPGLRASA